MIPDYHVGPEFQGMLPYDYQAFDLMIDAVWDFYGSSIDYIYILGDFAECFGVSAWTKDPRMNSILRDERDLLHIELSKLRNKWPNAEIVFIEGNHENRISRYTIANAGAFLGMVGVEDFIGVDKFNLHYVKYDCDQLVRVGNTNLFARHEPIKGGMHHCKNTAEKGANILYGHTHQLGRAPGVRGDNTITNAWSCGWLGNIKHPMFKYRQGFSQWEQGFALVNILNSQDFFVKLRPIKNGQLELNGILYY